MKKFLLIDSNNLFFRARHSTSGDPFSQIGLTLHIVLNCIRSAYKKFDADHIVFCMEGKSWRKEIYPSYKTNRLKPRTPKEQEIDTLFFETFNNFSKYLKNNTRCTILQHSMVEADDLIARWIDRHPDDQHIILSSDTDFKQLLANNVQIYDGVGKKIYKLSGVYDDKDQPIIDKKTKNHQEIEPPDYYLFKKIIKGDPTDNIFSAYPGVREKGSSKKIGILEAYEDRNNKGYAWNNFMNQEWVDHDGNRHVVKEKYEENKMLIDLRNQPSIIVNMLDETIDNAYNENKISAVQVGMSFVKFCGKYDLKKLLSYKDSYTEFFLKGLEK